MTTANARDLMLIARCQSGDREALDSLLREHEEAAYHYAMKLTGSRDEAADVVADAFLRVYRSADRFKGDSSFSTWLYRILMNCFLDMRKKAKRHKAISLDSPASESQLQIKQMPASNYSPHTIAFRRDRSRRFVAAMKLIPECQRAALVLVHSGKFTYQEISKLLGVPMGTVKSRIFTAKKTIRKHLVNEIDCFEM